MNFSTVKFGVLNLLLAHEVGVSAIRHIYPASLVEAAGNGYSEIVRILLDRNASVNATAANGCTSLMSAADKGHIEIVRLLLDSHQFGYLGRAP